MITQPRKSMEELYSLWDRLGNIPFLEDHDSELSLDEPFLHFPVGTSCVDVWHWFEDQNTNFSVGELMNGVRR